MQWESGRDAAGTEPCRVAFAGDVACALRVGHPTGRTSESTLGASPASLLVSPPIPWWCAAWELRIALRFLKGWKKPKEDHSVACVK